MKTFLAGDLKRFLIPVIALAAVVIFFLSYNTYLVDHSIEDLKFVLDQTARAQTITESNRVGVILDDLLIEEMSAFNINSRDVTNLEFAKNVVAKGGVKQQLEDVDFLLNKLVREKEKKRGGILIALDRMNTDIRRVVNFATRKFMKGAARPELFKPSQNIDFSILQKGKKYESDWQLKEAISAYEEFINRYPFYQKILLTKLRLADCYFKSGNYREAKKLYEKLIEDAPHSDEAQIAGVLLSKTEERIKKQSDREKIKDVISKLTTGGITSSDYGELKVADEYLAKLDKETNDLIMYVMEGVKATPQSEAKNIDLGLLDKAKELESKWQLKEAESIYSDFILKYPNYEKIVSVKLLLGGVYLKSLQYEKALSYYEGIAKNHPGSQDAKLAKKLIDKTKEIIAISTKRQSLVKKISKMKTVPELAQAYYDLAMVDLYLFDLGNSQEAFKKVMELVPGTPLGKRAEFNLGWVYKFGAEYDKGIQVFSKITERYPQEKLATDSAYQIADSHYKSGDFKAAAESYKNFAAKTSDPSLASMAEFQAGYTYLYNLHDPIKAASTFKSLNASFSNTDVSRYASSNIVSMTERSYRDYGFILLRNGKFKEAEDAFKKAIIINQNDSWAYCGLGTAYSVLSMPEKAIQASTEGIKKMSDGYTRAALAFAYQQTGDYDKAIEEYRLSIKQNPGYATSYYNLGRIYVILGWYDLATEQFKEALKILPGFAEAHNDLGITYWYQGQLVSAEFEFKQAISYRGDSAEAQYNLGLVYETAGKYHKAAACFERALMVIPDFTLARRHLERMRAKIKK